MTPYYESPRGIAEYLLFHFGSPEDTFDFGEFHFDEYTNYPVRCLRQGFDPDKLIRADDGPTRALDLGCAVGASTFELSRFHDETTGIDFSHAFIRSANEFLKRGHLDIQVSLEGNLTRELRINLPEGIKAGDQKIRFEQGDAANLRKDIGQFQTVFAGNLIDRLPDPEGFLRSLTEITLPGSQLILTSPYTWLREYTPEENWLQRENKDTFEGIRKILEPNFACSRQFNIPFILREHRRKFQLTLAHASSWVRVK